MWGKITYPTSTWAELVYSGKAGGSRYNAQEGAAKKFCLPDDPDCISATGRCYCSLPSIIFGAEYKWYVLHPLHKLIIIIAHDLYINLKDVPGQLKYNLKFNGCFNSYLGFMPPF